MSSSIQAMGWAAYRGHLLLTHGGGIDGFTALVSFMPRDKTGIVVLTNKSGTLLTQIVTYNLFDRLFELDQVP